MGKRLRKTGDTRKSSGNLGQLLREIRIASGQGLKSVAPELGVDYSYLSKIENDITVPSTRLLSRMAEYYGADENAMFEAADRWPPDIVEILRDFRDEAFELLRTRFRDV